MVSTCQKKHWDLCRGDWNVCGVQAVCVRNGKSYCAEHDPIRVSAASKARGDKRRKEWEKAKTRKAKEAAAEDMYRVLMSMRSAEHDPMAQGDPRRKKLLAALAKAERVQKKNG